MTSEKSQMATEAGKQNFFYNDERYHQLKLKLFGTLLVTLVLVAGFVGVVYIQSKTIQQLSVLDEDNGNQYKVVEETKQQVQTTEAEQDPRIYFFENVMGDLKILVDLDRDLTIIKNVTTGNCFLTYNENVPLIENGGKIDGDLQLEIIRKDNPEEHSVMDSVLRYDETAIIPPEYLTATTHKAARGMCNGHQSYWADNGRVAVPRNRRQAAVRPASSICCYETYSCCMGGYPAWCVRYTCSNCGVAAKSVATWDCDREYY
ncbi:hypothetical protein HOLleu_35659 [Holothuria leucospilota]|uniref:BRICHOS domain-containing protein n=1 Tax=Holothuria leucospilota TaxID=206669 RepID=A0A9Q0YJA3_HOLLE|nr:hypothetical protein HOLleu_35659 [Holothuria leucospilota]